MLHFHKTKQKFAFLFMVLILAGMTGHTQKVQRPQPKWWFGESGAANFNYLSRYHANAQQ